MITIVISLAVSLLESPPLEQGLKRYSRGRKSNSTTKLLESLPLEQGLKLMIDFSKIVGVSAFRVTTIRTRIET